jgi:hypothetical protein
MKTNRFPEGWDDERIRRVIDHYESQSQADAVAEDEAPYEHEEPTSTLIEVPTEIVPAVRDLIAKHHRD